MPFINTKYSADISTEQERELKERFAKAVQLIGKTESWLMVGFEKGCSLYFKGEKCEKAAFVEVSLYGSAPSASYGRMTAEICGALNGVLGVPEDKIYVKYSPTDDWGWNGGNF